MQFHIGKYQIQTNDVLQAYKNAQRYVIESAKRSTQKMVQGAYYLANLIKTFASQIYTYVQDASHRLLPSRVSIINLKSNEQPAIEKAPDQSANYSLTPSTLEENNTTTNLTPPTLDAFKDDSEIKSVPSDAAPLGTTTNDSDDMYQAGLFMTALLTVAAFAKAFKGHSTHTKSDNSQQTEQNQEAEVSVQNPVLEHKEEKVTTTQNPLPQPTQMSREENSIPTPQMASEDSKLNSVSFLAKEIASAQNPLPEPVQMSRKENPIPTPQRTPEDSKLNSESFILDGATTSQKLLPEPSSNRVIYGRPSRVETQLPPILLPASDKPPSNIQPYNQTNIHEANLEQGIAIMNNLFKTHGENPVPWITIRKELKPVLEKQIKIKDILNRFDIKKSLQGVLLRSLKPRI